MPARSAGLLLYRTTRGSTEVLLVHPGGPLWRNKDVGAWQIPKGLIELGEDEEAAARREVSEELGTTVDGPLVSLGETRQAGGKVVIAFAAEHDIDPASVVSNMIEIEWPPRSGQKLAVPEIDEARWFGLDEARHYMLKSQTPLLDRLLLAWQDGPAADTDQVRDVPVKRGAANRRSITTQGDDDGRTHR
jgi:predicted NUDIX family NTP pyrophosphohydrolase